MGEYFLLLEMEPNLSSFLKLRCNGVSADNLITLLAGSPKACYNISGRSFKVTTNIFEPLLFG